MHLPSKMKEKTIQLSLIKKEQIFKVTSQILYFGLICVDLVLFVFEEFGIERKGVNVKKIWEV